MTPSSIIRVLLVDDHAVVREGYRRLMEKHDDLEVVAEAADGAAAYEKYKNDRPDVVLLDLSMPGKGGLEAIRQIRQWDSNARLLVFSMHLNAIFATQAFQAGTMGYVTKSSPPDLLIEAIRDVFHGKKVLSPDISRELAISHVDGDASLVDGLTAREFDIFRMLVEAKSVKEIASTLNLSVKTVNNYHYLIKSKLGVTSDVELVHLATRLNIVNP